MPNSQGGNHPISGVDFTPGARPIVVAGIVALAVAMGIGRFAFTPILPLMLRDGLIDNATAAEWAAANYLGYFAGALTAARLWAHGLRYLKLALSGVALCTALGAFVHAAAAGAALRCAAGAFSAWVLVLASSWCLDELARQDASRWGAWIYSGVGIGIASAGALVWLGGLQPAWALWLELGLLAALGTAHVCVALPASDALPPAARAASPPRTCASHIGLVVCYGAMGLGYIIPATFLPALARTQAADPLVFGLTWPLFGLAAAVSVAVVARALAGAPRRRVWAAAQGLMALGTGLVAVDRSLASLALSALVVGGTFMIPTTAGLQLARQLVPQNPTPLIARMTAAFAVGQIAGPVVVRLLGARLLAGLDAIALASAAAALLLAATAAWLWLSERR